MKPRTTLILAAVLVVLVAAAAVFETGHKRSRSATGKPLFPGYAAEQATRITIQGPTNEVDLQKAGDTWTVASEGGKPAEPRLTKQILDGIGEFDATNLISTSPERQAAFGVDSTGYTVRVLADQKPVAEFVVGKAGPDFMSSYIRPAGGEKVYQVPVSMRSLVDRQGESWRKTTVLDVASDDVVGYTTKTARETVSVQKDPDGTWSITEPVQAKARPDIMGVVIRSLAPIRSSGFADSSLTAEEMGLSPDTTSVVIRTSDGSSHTVIIGATNQSSQSYTRLEGDPDVYLVPRGRWNTVLRPLATLKVEEAPAAAGTSADSGESKSDGK